MTSGDITLGLMIAVGLYAGSKIKSSADYSGGSRKAGAAIVAGTLLGTIVGGASTIGTAQLAFQFGLDAWWFTIGAGVGALMLGWGMLKPLYHSNKETIPQILVETYGDKVGPITSVGSAIGIFLSIMSQGIATVALLTTLFHMNTLVASLIGVGLVLAYVLSGGILGTGMSGMVKISLLYTAMIVVGVMAYSMFGGMAGIHVAFPAKFPWYSFFGRGFSKDISGGISLVVGILSTQTYFQAVLSGKSIGASRLGALVSAVLIPPIGIGGIMVGLYMKANVALFPGLKSAEVLPTFVLAYLPPLVAGLVLATLLIAAVGTWAGLSLGVATMLTRDLYQRYINPSADGKKTLLIQRGLIIVICILAVYAVSTNAGALILGFSFLSLGLRGCTCLLPLLGALFFKKLVTPAAGIAAAILGPVTNIFWAFAYPKGMDPLYPGLMAATAAIVIVSLVTKKKAEEPEVII